MLASVTTLPVIGVPVPLAKLDGLDSLLSIVQMPAGIPVATVAIGGARNAGLLAARILGASDPALTRPARRVRGRSRATRRREEREVAARAVTVSNSSIAASSPVRTPDTRSPKLMTKRAWWLVGLNVLIPGSAQVLAGDRRLGRFGLGSTLVLWALLVLTGVLYLFARGFLIGLLTNTVVLWLLVFGRAVLRRALDHPDPRHPAAGAARAGRPRRRAPSSAGCRSPPSCSSPAPRATPLSPRPRGSACSTPCSPAGRSSRRSTVGTTSCCSAATPDPTARACVPTASRSRASTPRPGRSCCSAFRATSSGRRSSRARRSGGRSRTATTAATTA